MTLEELKARPDELTDEERETISETIEGLIWKAVNDAFGLDVFDSIFGGTSESEDKDLKGDIADTLIADIGAILRELGPLASRFIVPEEQDAIRRNHIIDAFR